jgi:adenosylcobinamide-GDP ribazoletransferase
LDFTMNEWLDDFKTAVGFLTRLPMPHPEGAMPPNFVRAQRMFGVVGAMIGAAVGLLCLGLRTIGVPDLAAAALALGAGAILTGALHEDGLADVADGFGGGRDVTAKLEIMRDSRRPDAATAAIAAALALVIALLLLPWMSALGAALVAGLSGLGMAWLAQRQIGGQTGDVLGGAEQIAETAILVLLAARLA